MKIHNDIDEALKILGAVSDLIELMAINEDFPVSRNSLPGAVYVMDEAIADIVEF